MGAGVMPIGALQGPPAPGWHVSQRFVNAEGFPIVLIPPPPPALLGVPPLWRIPRLSDLTHHPPFGAQLASLGDPGPTSRRAYCFSAKLTGSQTCRH